ncbi:MAG: DUF4230 domain-containing protein [Lachnospiraceae bacterium]|nr:DUF4230 domain-containing protein [Lachnospiraceae bacterium]
MKKDAIDTETVDNENEEKPTKRPKRKRGFKSKLIAFIIGCICGIALMIVQPWEQSDSFQKLKASNPGTADTVVEVETNNKAKKADVTISYLQELTKTASDLVTTKYYYKDANTYSSSKQIFNHKVPLTTDEFVYTYEGKISLGIDVSEIKFNVDNANKKIEIDMPDIKIIANEIDEKSFDIIDSKNSIFNETDLSDTTSLLATLKEQKADKVMNDQELLDDANNRSEEVIRDLIEHSDLAAGYQITFT